MGERGRDIDRAICLCMGYLAAPFLAVTRVSDLTPTAVLARNKIMVFVSSAEKMSLHGM